MTKAINWPQQYLNEVINEDSEKVRAALRLDAVYYDHSYYVPEEIIDIRVNHKIIRQGIIIGEMKLCKIKDLSEEDFTKLKSDIQTPEKIIKYLSTTYDKEVKPDSEVTVIYYRNLTKEETADRIDDPHM
jgi:hypothetical protein